MTTLDLWWSLLWRLTSLLFVLSFVMHPAAYLLLGVGDPRYIFYRPSVAWWLLAALFWIAGAASPRFVRLVLWGERLRLADAQWLALCRGLAVFFVTLGLLNLGVARFGSLVTWVNFKLFWPYPLLVATLIPLAMWVRKANAQSNP
jgi:intracellular septation protein A